MFLRNVNLLSRLQRVFCPGTCVSYGLLWGYGVLWGRIYSLVCYLDVVDGSQPDEG